jgi:death-on-curing protein
VTAYLSLTQLLRVHERQIRAFGGSLGLRDKGAAEAALARPQLTFGGEDLYPDLESKAAALMHSIVLNHPFIDGNKRAGVMAAELLLRINGVELIAGDDEMAEMTLAVARGEVTAEAVSIWLRQRCRRER